MHNRCKGKTRVQCATWYIFKYITIFFFYIKVYICVCKFLATTSSHANYLRDIYLQLLIKQTLVTAARTACNTHVCTLNLCMCNTYVCVCENTIRCAYVCERVYNMHLIVH